MMTDQLEAMAAGVDPIGVSFDSTPPRWSEAGISFASVSNALRQIILQGEAMVDFAPQVTASNECRHSRPAARRLLRAGDSHARLCTELLDRTIFTS